MTGKPQHQNEKQTSRRIAAEIIDLTVSSYKKRWPEMIVWAMVIVYSTIAVQEMSRRFYLQDNLWMFAAVFILGFLALTTVSIGYARLSFAVVDGRRLSVRDALDNLNVFLQYVVTVSSLQIFFFIGIFLLVVPGVAFMLTFGFAPLLVIDEKLRPIAAYKRSMNITRGYRLELLAVYLAALLVGVLIIGPWSLLPGPIGKGLGYAAVTIVFSFVTVLSAAVMRVLQQRFYTHPASER